MNHMFAKNAARTRRRFPSRIARSGHDQCRDGYVRIDKATGHLLDAGVDRARGGVTKARCLAFPRQEEFSCGGANVIGGVEPAFDRPRARDSPGGVSAPSSGKMFDTMATLNEKNPWVSRFCC